MPTQEDIAAAHRRVAPVVHRTPVLRSRYFDEALGAEVFFKAENLQKVGAFKIRGAANVLFSMSEGELARGVVTHSSGNHAQAVALAARLRRARAVIVMPENSAAVKLAAVKDYGAEVRLCEATLEARETTAAKVVEETGGTFVHPYDDPRIVAGQGTAAKELLEEISGLDLILVPVGGGGLASGTALAALYQERPVRVIGTEPAGADDAYRSLAGGTRVPSVDPRTVADGLRSSLGALPFEILRRHLDGSAGAQVLTVSEEGILAAMRQVWERMKTLIEPSAAVPVAALFEHRQRLKLRGLRVGVVLSGGNVDLDSFFRSYS